MKVFATVLMASATLLAGAAQAELVQAYPPEVNAPSHETRAQVLAELRAAQAAGLVSTQDDATYPPVIVGESSKSRAQVLAELDDAIDAGQLRIGDRQAPNVYATTHSGSRS